MVCQEISRNRRKFCHKETNRCSFHCQHCSCPVPGLGCGMLPGPHSARVLAAQKEHPRAVLMVAQSSAQLQQEKQQPYFSVGNFTPRVQLSPIALCFTVQNHGAACCRSTQRCSEQRCGTAAGEPLPEQSLVHFTELSHWKRDVCLLSPWEPVLKQVGQWLKVVQGKGVVGQEPARSRMAIVSGQPKAEGIIAPCRSVVVQQWQHRE